MDAVERIRHAVQHTCSNGTLFRAVEIGNCSLATPVSMAISLTGKNLPGFDRTE